MSTTSLNVHPLQSTFLLMTPLCGSSLLIDSSQKRLAIRLQAEVENLSARFSKWLLSVNVHKSALLILSSRSNHPEQLSIRIGDSVIPQVRHHKHLGVTLSESLMGSIH